MWTYDVEARTVWFSPTCLPDTQTDYRMAGALVGLAIYNSILLDVHFPPALFYMLTVYAGGGGGGGTSTGTTSASATWARGCANGKDGWLAGLSLKDQLSLLAGLNPGLATGLSRLLEWDQGNVEAIFCR